MVVNSSALQRVDGATFYHFHKSGNYDDLWRVGNEITFDGKSFNKYYAYYFDYKPTFVLYNQINPLQTLPNFVKDLQESAKSLDFNIRELINLPAKLSEIITNLTVWIREEIFEDVRKSQFSIRPSRKTCLFVCDELKVDDWKSLLAASNVDMTLFRLSLTGTIFRANERYVHLDEYGTEFFRKNAGRYWQGVQGNDNDGEEILFHGKAKILDVV